jgi:hypothetical protein
MQSHVPYIEPGFFNLSARARFIIHIYAAACFKEDSISRVFVDAMIIMKGMPMGVVDFLCKCFAVYRWERGGGR